uniref:Tubulin--tyrosine ligase n=1 Tax=Eutreptiella gymnastica TaxID=73025 RepID=A0A7S1JDB9_9EUGL
MIHGRKFDIRCWVLLTAPYDVYLFDQASLRTASEPYDPNCLGANLSHLTNHCLQIQHPDFGKWEAGNEMWWWQLQQYFDSAGRGCSLEQDIYPQIRRHVRDSLLSVQDHLALSPDYRAFQLFGFDFMIDDSFKVWLLEINGSPAAAEVLYDSIVEGMVRICLDPVYPPGPDLPPEPLPEVAGLGMPQFHRIHPVAEGEGGSNTS